MPTPGRTPLPPPPPVPEDGRLGGALVSALVGTLVGTLALAVCASTRLAAQPPTTSPDSAAADTTAAAHPRAEADAAGAPDADSADVYRRFSVAEYRDRVLSPRSLVRDVAISGLTQAAKRPSEWSRTWGGYGDRLSSRLATDAISQAVLLGLATTRDERPANFTRCYCVGTGPRLLHATLTPYTMNAPNGKHFSLLGPLSEVGSSILVTSVQPRGFSVRDGVRSGLFGILATSGFSALREFWPWHKRPFGL